jgi:glucosamine--fructose-6-phosphate aminotransferase (isomerizing)
MVHGQYLLDILDQPAALADTVAGLGQVAALAGLGGFSRVLLTGMGGSFHALQPLLMRLVEHGLDAVAYETAELIYYFEAALRPGTLVVAVSQSGRSVEMVRLLDMAAGRVKIVGVTNTPDSPLAARADWTVLTRAGAEATVSCKTFVATLAALEWVGAALRGADHSHVESELRGAAEAVQAYLEGWESKVAALDELLGGVRAVFLTGRGTSMAAAGAGGLTLKESAHFHAEGMTCSAFRHGPLEMCGPDVFVMVFAGDAKTRALNEKLVLDVRKAGARAALVGPQSDRRRFGFRMSQPRFVR